MNNELYHYGIKGMKWGIRRYQPYSTTGPRRSGKSGKEIGIARSIKAARQKKYNSSDYATAKKMSNQELQERINRINLEQSYISAMSRDKKAAKEASEFAIERYGKNTVRSVTNMLTGTGTNLARNTITNTVNDNFPITKKRKK